MLQREKMLKFALVAFGAVFCLVYPLAIFWPSGWAWHEGSPADSQYFMMIVGVYATLGVFLIRAASNPSAHRSLIWFTVWSSAVHAGIMASQSFNNDMHRGHLLGDVPALLLVTIVLGALLQGDKVTGIPTLVDLFGDRVIDRFCTWLEIKPAEQGPTILFDAPALEPDERIEWRDILDNTPLSADRLPYWMERLVAHIHPYTCMFPDDWSVMLALPYWSALWPKPLLQNLHLNIWTLGLGIQGIGKNIATDELIAILAGVSGDDREDGIVLYTAGSPEGMWDALDGTGKRMFCYHDEFAGFLKLLRRDHMQSARESLCSLYDGRVVAYHRARKNSITILNPHVAVAATTTPAAIREFAEAQDLSNGYLSRFMICAPDAYQIAPAYYPSDSVARRDLVRELAAHLHRYRDISAIHWDGSGQDDPDRLLAYREHLGMNNGALIDLDRRSSDEVIPVGRLLARVKKIAALLELAERSPNVAGETAYVRSEHLETAIDIVERSYAYAVRVVNWVGLSPDYELSHRVYQLLTEQREGMTQRELCRRTHRKASEMKIALELLISDGRVASRKVGRAERWIAA